MKKFYLFFLLFLILITGCSHANKVASDAVSRNSVPSSDSYLSPSNHADLQSFQSTLDADYNERLFSCNLICNNVMDRELPTTQYGAVQDMQILSDQLQKVCSKWDDFPQELKDIIINIFEEKSKMLTSIYLSFKKENNAIML
jgi:hypothetical protein